MGVTISKKKTSTKKKEKIKVEEVTKNTPLEIQQAVDDYIELKTKVTKAKNKMEKLAKELAQTRKPIDKHIEENYGVKDAGTLKTKNNIATFGAKGKKTELTDKEKLYELLEDLQEGLYFEVSGVSITDIKKYLSTIDQKKCLKTTHKNARSFKVEGTI